MDVKRYDTLPADAARIRTTVFVEEQGFVNELDDIDNIAVHFVMYDDGVPVATCRVFWDETMHSYLLGRLAVVKSCRGKMLGAKMMEKAEEYVRASGGKCVALHAQCRAEAFYQKQGYESRGEIGEEEGCPHVWMYKEFD